MRLRGIAFTWIFLCTRLHHRNVTNNLLMHDLFYYILGKSVIHLEPDADDATDDLLRNVEVGNADDVNDGVKHGET